MFCDNCKADLGMANHLTMGIDERHFGPLCPKEDGRGVSISVAEDETVEDSKEDSEAEDDSESSSDYSYSSASDYSSGSSGSGGSVTAIIGVILATFVIWLVGGLVLAFIGCIIGAILWGLENQNEGANILLSIWTVGCIVVSIRSIIGILKSK